MPAGTGAKLFSKIQRTSSGVLIYAPRSAEIYFLVRISNLTEFEGFFQAWEYDTVGCTKSMEGMGWTGICEDFVFGAGRRAKGWSCALVTLCFVGQGILAIQFWSTTENEGNEQEGVEQVRRYRGQGG